MTMARLCVLLLLLLELLLLQGPTAGRAVSYSVPTWRRFVSGRGFHRSLDTTLDIAHPHGDSPPRGGSGGNGRNGRNGGRGGEDSGASCIVVLVETFERGVYVDLDEVRELNRLRAPHVPEVLPVSFSGSIDVERPADVSSEHTVACVARNWTWVPTSSGGRSAVVHWSLPIHLRYQAPSSEPFATAKVARPDSAWLGCPGSAGSADTGNTVPGPGVQVRDAKGLQMSWTWSKLTLPDNKEADVAVMAVPVGLLADAGLIHVGTALATLAGAAFLVVEAARFEQRGTLERKAKLN